MFLADSCGFFAGQLDPQIADPDIKLDLVSLTCSRPTKDARNMLAIKQQTGEMIKIIENQQQLRIVKSKGDLYGLGNGTTGVVFRIQAPPEDRGLGVKELKELRKMGIIFSGIAYDMENVYGSGFANPTPGLTDAGREYMENCAEAGIFIDLSHAGHQTADEALELAYENRLLPIVATHTACYDVYRHLRNLPDVTLESIAAQGGFVGILSLTSFLAGKTSEADGIDAFFEHLMNAVGCCSDSNVCIGSDGYYCHRDLKKWEGTHNALIKKLADAGPHFQVRWPDQPLSWTRPDRMDLVTQELGAWLDKVIGIMPGALDNIAGKNFFRFLQKNL